MKGLLGKKVGMTQVFDEDGNLVPVTVIDASTCAIVGKKTAERDGYTALVVGLGDVKESRLNKARAGAFKKAGATAKARLKEFRVQADEVGQANIGDAVKVELFQKGQLVDITGVSKGRGFQGVVRRWSFKGAQTNTRGTHEHRRHPGAIGQRKTPGRVYPNKKLPGHYGVENITTQNLQVVDVDAERNLLLIKGAVPGHNQGVVMVRPAVKGAMRAAHGKE
ncbi:MAG: 50S ribosomal protein L3 [Myxococcaceae bacterium]